MQMLEKLTLEEVKNLIANAQSQKAIDSLVDLSKYRREEYNIDNQTNKEILLLSSRYKSIARKKHQGVIDQSDLDLEMNKVNLSLIELVEDMESRVGALEVSSVKSNKAIYGLYVFVGMIALAIITPLLSSGEEDPAAIGLLRADGTEVLEGNAGGNTVEQPTASNTSLTATEENEIINAVAYEVIETEEQQQDKVMNASLNTPLSNSERGMVNSTNSRSTVFWRSTASNYAVYDKGEKLRNTESAYSGNDGIVYDPDSGKTYFLKDFKTTEDSKLRPGKLLSDTEDIFWRASETKYAVYEKGEKVKGIEGSYSNDDYIVYHAKSGRTYLLEDFNGVEDSVLRPGKLLSDTHEIFWRASETKYAVYDKGEKLVGTESDYSGDDLIVYYPETGETFLLEDFSGVEDGVLRPGKLME